MAPDRPARAATVPGGRPADPLVRRAGLRRSRMALGLGAHFGASDRARLLLSWVVQSMTRLRPESGSPASSVLLHAPIATARGPRCAPPSMRGPVAVAIATATRQWCGGQRAGNAAARRGPGGLSLSRVVFP